MRDGAVVHDARTADMTPDEMVRRMVGRDLSALFPKQDADVGATVLKVERLTREGVFFDVSFEVRAGEIVALAGLVGAGRSEVARAIFGIDKADAGHVEVAGRRLPTGRPLAAMRAGIGFVPEDRRIFADLTVWENLDVATRRTRAGGFTVERVYELFPKLAELRDRQGGFLSGGEQQMLTIARTLMGNPELLLLDEPSEGLAPLVVAHLGAQIGRLKREGLTILLAEQNVDFSLELADRVYVLEKGTVRYEGSVQAFRADESIRHQYLAL
jgi:ABC-type branched-subunit amino acid transport system ATPase component